MLWDTGHALTAGAPVPRSSIVDQLAQVNIKPEQIKYVGISHYLADHTGQVASFPGTTLLKRQLLQSAVLHADESPITVLDKGGRRGRGYIWAYASGQHENIHAVDFEIKADRGGQYARVRKT